MSGDPEDAIRNVLQSGRNVRLGRGIVSKTSYIAGMLIVVWGTIAWRWSENIAQDVGLMMIGLAATAFAVWFIRGTRQFAERNPALALLEGAELLEWRKLEVAAKGIPPIPNAPLIEDRGGQASDRASA